MQPTPADVVDALDQVIPTEPPMWTEVHGAEDSDDARLVVHADLSELFGWVAPPGCTALGVVAGGWGRPTGDDAVAGGGDVAADGGPPGRGIGERLRVIVVVDRTGELCARTTFGDGNFLDGGCQGGRLVDALRRGLGLATAAPPGSSASLLGNLWLMALIAGGEGRRRRSWPEAAQAHPAARVLTGGGHHLSLEETEALIRVTPRVWSWERMRLDTAAGGGLRHLVAPELAAWMDTGMFARWALEADDRPVDLWGRAAATLEPEAVVRLAQVLDDAEAAASRLIEA